MAEFKDEGLGLRFTIPDKPTIRQQLMFRDAILEARGKVNQIRMWEGALPLIDEWECAELEAPELLDLDKETNPKMANIITFVAGNVAGHMTGIGAVSKND